jgi:hypothetical protein
MTKQISIIRGNESETYDEFHTRIKDLSAKFKSSTYLHYTITLELPPKRSVIPFRTDKIALISLKANDDAVLEPLTGESGFSGTFTVDEALPIAYTKDWPDGETTPGVCLLTLFRQKKNIDREAFINRWHNGHTPLTLKIHPIYHYSRNEVIRAAGNPPVHYDGIVEEHCRTESELFNPFKFFAKSGFAPINMIKTYFDVNSFIDYKSIETYLVREYVLIG